MLRKEMGRPDGWQKISSWWPRVIIGRNQQRESGEPLILDMSKEAGDEEGRKRCSPGLFTKQWERMSRQRPGDCGLKSVQVSIVAMFVANAYIQRMLLEIVLIVLFLFNCLVPSTLTDYTINIWLSLRPFHSGVQTW